MTNTNSNQYGYDPYNEIDKKQRHNKELNADPRIFFYPNGNPFLGFMHFLRRVPVPKKQINEQWLMEDFSSMIAQKRKMGTIIAIIFIAAVVLLFIPFVNILSFILIMLGLALSIIAYPHSTDKGNRRYSIYDYKGYIVEKALSSIVEELVYEPHFGLPIRVFDYVNIVKPGTSYETEDLVTGKYNNVYFVQFDLKVVESFNKHNYIHFDGKWVIIDYPKHFTGTVTIADKNFIYDVKQKELEKIQLENPTFNSIFDVRASDMQLAYYLLTPQFIERLVFIKQNIRGRIIASFKDGMFHIGISNGENSFEPNEKNIDIQADIEKFKYEFSLVSGLIEILEIDNNAYT